MHSNPVQDVAPKGGFKPFMYQRNVRNRGPGVAGLFGGALFAVCYGFYALGQGNVERRRLKEEKRQARINIVPVLQAEEDIRFVRERREELENEKELMKNVPGWEVGASPYSSNKRWIPPSTNEVHIA